MDRRRIFADAKLLLAEPTADKPVQLAGYAMRWNSLSDDRGGFKVRLLPGSAIAATPTAALYNHNRGEVLGTTANGTLRISNDDVGVRVEIDLPDTSYARDTATLVRGGYVAGMSFYMAGEPAFRAIREGGQDIIEVSRFVYDEVSVLGNPAFADTSIGIKHFSARTALSRNKDRLRQFTLTKYRLQASELVAAAPRD